MTELDRLTVDDFRSAQGGRFVLDLDRGGSLELKLVAARTHVADAPPTDAEGRRSPFSVEFRGPADPVLEQRIYRIESDALGTLEIFIVPVARDESGTRYEAVFA